MRPAIAVLVGVVLVGFIGGGLSAGQWGGGRRSPHESVSAKIEGATMTIEYGRPYMRGRTIFGGLVPYQIVWCPGADAATTLDSTRPLRFCRWIRSRICVRSEACRYLPILKSSRRSSAVLGTSGHGNEVQNS